MTVQLNAQHRPRKNGGARPTVLGMHGRMGGMQCIQSLTFPFDSIDAKMQQAIHLMTDPTTSWPSFPSSLFP